jgi:hypothetical protein
LATDEGYVRLLLQSTGLERGADVGHRVRPIALCTSPERTITR